MRRRVAEFVDGSWSDFMISTSYQCIFVMISKVASTSIRVAFHEKSKPSESGYFGGEHNTIAYYREKYPQQFQAYFKFALVRNPWDRIHSQYLYQRYTRQFEFANCSFQEWLLRCDDHLQRDGAFPFARNREIFVHHLTDQLGWVTLDGRVAVDFIGRYETLQADFAKVCERIKADITLPKHNVSQRQSSYVPAYGERDIELVARWHSKDIEYFGYEFAG
jgi:chondroitin 4-sulfotransferase 11